MKIYNPPLIFPDVSEFQGDISPAFDMQGCTIRIYNGYRLDKTAIRKRDQLNANPRVKAKVGYVVPVQGMDPDTCVRQTMSVLPRDWGVMIDEESGAGFHGSGDHSNFNNDLRERFLRALGAKSRNQVFGYANGSDWRGGWPRRGDMAGVVAGYSATMPAMAKEDWVIGWQYCGGDPRWGSPAGWPRGANGIGNNIDMNVWGFPSGDAMRAWMLGGSSGSVATPATPIKQEDDMRFPFIGGPNSRYPNAVFVASGGTVRWVPSESTWRNTVYAIGQENAITHPGVYGTPVNFQNGRAVSADYGTIPKVDDISAFGVLVGPTPDNPRDVNPIERELMRRSDAATGRRPLGPGDVLLPGAPSYDVSKDGGKLRDRLGVDEKLLPGQTLWSADRSRQFSLQTDGSLALYDAAGYIWHAPGSTGKKVTGLVVQKDGSVVLYDDKGAVWNMGTYGKPVKELVVQNDANIVAIGADGTVYANTGTRCI